MKQNTVFNIYNVLIAWFWTRCTELQLEHFMPLMPHY